MRYNFKHNLLYIDWSKEAVVKERVTIEQFNDKVKMIKAQPNAQVAASKTIRVDYKDGCYRITKKGNYYTLFARINGEYVMYSTNGFDDDKNKREDKYPGTEAWRAISSHFQERTGLGRKALYNAFGTTGPEFKACVPKQFYYVNGKFTSRCQKGEVIRGVGSIDGCSHYPSNLCGRLPDAKSSIQLEGTVEPTAEYPFAFYLKSGLTAEYGVYDAHDWLEDEQMFMRLFSPEGLKRASETKRDEDITVLMKASEYELTEEFEYFFPLRKVDAKAKLVMNAGIGMMHRKDDDAYMKGHMYAHLAAIAIGRANAKHLNMMRKIGYRNIIHVCVDGIIYLGSAEYGIKEKKLGAYNQEFTNCDILITKQNFYIVKDKQGNVVKVKHGGANVDKNGELIKDEEVKDFNELFGWSIDRTKMEVDA